MVTRAEIKELEASVARSRADLAARWCSFEQEVVSLANSATDEVSQTVQYAKDTVQQAKEAVSIPYQVRKRPWSMLGGALLTGLALSRGAGLKKVIGLGLMTAVSRSALPDLKFGDLRSNTTSSLVELAKALVRRNVPTSLAPMMEQAITRGANNLFGPAPISVPLKRAINERGESVVVS